MKQGVALAAGVFLGVAFVFTAALNWPSGSGTTAPGVVLENGTTGALASITSTPATVTPSAGTTATVATGGTAVTLLTGPVNGGYVVNPLNTAAQGVTAENAYIDPVASPGSTDAVANGTTTLLAAGQVYSIPPMASGLTLKANAATSGHKLTVVKW